MLRLPMGVLVTLLLAAAAFIHVSSASLPPVVASHFAAGGAANGFMPRDGYVALMTVLVVVVPLFLAGVSSLVAIMPVDRINLPNREYWLAPERVDDTMAFLQAHGRYLALLLAAFLCFVHWLVVLANGQQPPLFPERRFLAGLSLFLLAMLGWGGVLVLRFRRRRQGGDRR